MKYSEITYQEKFDLHPDTCESKGEDYCWGLAVEFDEGNFNKEKFHVEHCRQCPFYHGQDRDEEYIQKLMKGEI